MKQKTITLVTATLGSLDIVVKENPTYPNTFEIGNKRIDFSEILPETINLRDCDDYHIIIWDGTKSYINVVLGNTTYTGTIDIRHAATEEILVY